MAEAGPKNDREPARHQVHRVASSVLNLIPDNESAPEWIYLGVWSAEHERFVMLRTKKTSSIARVKMDVIDALNCSKVCAACNGNTRHIRAYHENRDIWRP